jgi:resuscitation-promoting factor RpfB
VVSLPFAAMPSSTPHPPLRRRALRWAGLASVGVLALGATAAVAVSNVHAIEVLADGDVVEVRAFGGLTVADALARADVDLATADEVEPALGTDLADGDTVEVARAITVDVAVGDGVARRITAPLDTVDEVLAAADMEDLVEGGALVEPAPGSPVADGDTIVVTLPVTVTVQADGEEIEVVTLASSVSSVLREAGVEVGEDDIVTPAKLTPLSLVSMVTVERVETVLEEVEVSLDFDEVRRETADLRKGRTRVDREGREGLRVDTYEITTVDGEESDRERVSSEVVREPVDRVVLVGTYEPPPPPPPAPRPTSSSSSSSTSSSSSSSSNDVWERLAQCESGGNWQAVSRNGLYYGGLQFHPDTWRSVGGSGMPHQASKDEQIRRGKILQQRSGWGQWPACSLRLGLR